MRRHKHGFNGGVTRHSEVVHKNEDDDPDTVAVVLLVGLSSHEPPFLELRASLQNAF